ncbi:hypothetical protein [Phycicoccus flavus]|uniref:Uncharacterized protein n=1 Tax=Phycicoccus flavus TaxID=2502783 RepID=A0A8T6RA12_9MICO|nr:hypothetical protein [Phycicoccus flavus]NHA70353.1 hypothetical protein [Phycicoccus flavus]
MSAFMGYEHASNAEVDPDWAIEMMDVLTATLGKLSADGRTQFRKHLEALASELPDDEFYDSWRDYYRGFPSALGWEEPGTTS